MRLPTRREPVVGHDLDGVPITLKLIVSKKLYVCPGCRGTIEIGSDHVLVQRSGPDPHHQHWHTSCASSLAREMDIARHKRGSSGR